MEVVERLEEQRRGMDMRLDSRKSRLNPPY